MVQVCVWTGPTFRSALFIGLKFDKQCLPQCLNTGIGNWK